MSLFSRSSCAVCGAEFNRTKYRINLHGKNVLVCPTCHGELMRRHSRESIAEMDRTGRLPSRRGPTSQKIDSKRGEAGGCASLIALIVIAWLVWSVYKAATGTP